MNYLSTPIKPAAGSTGSHQNGNNGAYWKDNSMLEGRSSKDHLKGVSQHNHRDGSDDGWPSEELEKFGEQFGVKSYWKFQKFG